ncbi:MAG: LLM class flavin-dependent oxidoreductase [Anaerolineae bacterium]|nr:LLM class flavin-dependent oxidoreductase [Anaerolineae bacterium]
MKYGFVFPGQEVTTAVAFAREAEAAGWDGFFVWDAVWATDPWVTLGAIAAVTERIRIGVIITPVTRRRPWKLASETATVDRLSGGRLILAVGLGAVDTGFTKFGEETDRKVRAERLDEGLDIITGLWQGLPFAYDGKHYHVKPEKLHLTCPPPVQQPRIPIWVVGAWPRMKSMRRVLRYDGLLPDVMEKKGRQWKRRATTPDDIRAMHAFVDERRTLTTPFDIVMEGETPGDDAEKAAAIVQPWAEAGATWWIEAKWGAPDDPVRTRIQQGPPRF